MKFNIQYISLCLLVVVTVSYSQGNWELLIPSTTSNQMVSLYFIDAKTGYAVGKYGTITKSNDGGITWEIIEIEYLTGAGMQEFTAALIVEHAAGQADRDLLGVADSIRAVEAVVTEQVGVAGGGERGIEVRDIVLVLVGGVEEIKPRFQRLPPLSAAGVALEDESRIQAQGRQGPVQIVAAGVVLELVVGESDLQVGLEEIPAVR